MKTKLIILIAGLISVIGVFFFSMTVRAAIPEDGYKFPQDDYIKTKLWWRDDTHSECSQKDFAGVYMYKGLKTFDTKADCQRIDMPPVLNPPSTTPAKEVAINWPKAILLRIQEFFANIIARFSPALQNGRQEVPTNEVPTEKNSKSLNCPSDVLCVVGYHGCSGANGCPTCCKDTVEPSPQEIFCGGFAGKSCPAGYKCQLDGNYPDAGGTCIKK